ncbi:MAG: ribosome biogenesis GTPase Der [Chitinivibrionales bacterium]|nr:ribosome biogenesis GTPase Der [Chitinivibrionales bacterium]MBD3358636.1 ribosome biogenesis GTPase Der [Chitinivibrionales bacterium]
MAKSSLPIVSIVGRPNVGKSSLFNRVLRRRAAVIDATPGVTRDRNYMAAEWCGRRFMLVDTGGFMPVAGEPMTEEINRQVDIAMAESAVIVFVVDAGPGPTDLDELIARRLRRQFRERVILAVNKAENEESRLDASRNISLGCGDPYPISALHGEGVGDLLDKVCELLSKAEASGETETHPEEVRVAVVGRPNAGKSSFVNRVLNQERMIVDSVPGTTRDSIDTTVVLGERRVVIVDTAGLRRKSQVKDNVEYYANLRALASIERSDICVLMVDATEGMTEQNLKVVARVFENRKGIVVCWNKWDLVEKNSKTFDLVVAELRRQYMELRHVPVLAISALTGQRVRRALEAALAVNDRLLRRISTGEFGRYLTEWVRVRPHPFTANKDVRIMGGKQRPAEYPVFEFFCNHPALVLPSYKRYLINKIHETWDFEGCPIVLQFKRAGKRKRGRPADENQPREI